MLLLLAAPSVQLFPCVLIYYSGVKLFLNPDCFAQPAVEVFFSSFVCLEAFCTEIKSTTEKHALMNSVERETYGDFFLVKAHIFGA